MINALLLHDATSGNFYLKYAGVYKIKTEIESIGISCQVVDVVGVMSEEELQACFDKFVNKDTLFIGLSATFSTIVAYNGEKAARKTTVDPRIAEYWPFGMQPDVFRRLFSAVKAKYPKLQLIAGGALRGRPYNYLIDYYFTGMADRSIKAYIFDRLYDNKLITRPEVFGVTVSDKDYPHTLYPYDRGIVWTKKDVIFPGQVLPIELSRGCMFKCSYCVHDLKGKTLKDFLRSPIAIKDELMRNYTEFGVTDYTLADDMINDSVERLEILHSVFTSLPFKVQWGAFARLDVFDKHKSMYKLLREMGARYLTFGIETFDKVSGAAVGKGLGMKAIELIEETKEELPDTYLSSGFIIGLPGATEKTVRKDFELAVRHLHGFSFMPLYLTKGTAEANLFEAEKKGYHVTDKGYWVNAHMSMQDALLLAREFNEAAGDRTPSFGRFFGKQNIGLGKEFSVDLQDIDKAAPEYWKKHKQALFALESV